MCQLSGSAPTELPLTQEWQDGDTYCATCFRKAILAPKTPTQAHDLETTGRYWLNTFATLDNRTRSGVIATFSGIASRRHGSTS